MERTGILLSHNEITWLCVMWGTNNPDEFYAKMEGMTDEQLKEWARKARRKKGMSLMDSDLILTYA